MMTKNVPVRRPAAGTPKPNGRNGDNFSIVAEVGRTNSASNDRDEMEARLAGLSRASLMSIQKTSQKSPPLEKWSPQSQEASTASTAERMPAGEGRGAVPPPPLLDNRRYSDPWRIDYAGIYLQDIDEVLESHLTVLQIRQDPCISRHSKCNRSAQSRDWDRQMLGWARAHTIPSCMRTGTRRYLHVHPSATCPRPIARYLVEVCFHWTQIALEFCMSNSCMFVDARMRAHTELDLAV